jgi:hypothetical protein
MIEYVKVIVNGIAFTLLDFIHATWLITAILFITLSSVAKSDVMSTSTLVISFCNH